MTCTCCGKEIKGIKMLRPAANGSMKISTKITADDPSWKRVQAMFEAEETQHMQQLATHIKSARLKATCVGALSSTAASAISPTIGRVLHATVVTNLDDIGYRARRQEEKRNAEGSTMSEDRDVGKSMVSGLLARTTQSWVTSNVDCLVSMLASLTKGLRTRTKK